MYLYYTCTVHVQGYANLLLTLITDKLFCVSIIACFIILLAVTEPAAVQKVDDTVLKADGKHGHYN